MKTIKLSSQLWQKMPYFNTTAISQLKVKLKTQIINTGAMLMQLLDYCCTDTLIQCEITRYKNHL